MKVAGYISSSRTHELDREIELKIQTERIKEYCDKNYHDLVGIYEEPKDSREDYKPSLMSMLKDSSEKKFEKVIVIKLERFGEDNLVKAWIIDELKKNKVTIHSLTETIISKPIMTDEEASAKVKDIRQKVRDIPSLPEIVTKVMELVQDPNSSASQLGKMIAHDPGLTSRVLRLVNSAYYGFPKQISSIQHAIMILGFTTMRGLVLSSSIFKIFTPKGDSAKMLDYKKFWKHSLVTAIAARSIQKQTQINNEEDIFSSAILHDIGKIILDQYDHANYIHAFAQAPDPIETGKVIDAERGYCGITHMEIGHMIAEEWNLPENISRVIRYHHSPLKSKDHADLASIVYVANIFAHLILGDKQMDISLFDSGVLDHLAINEADLTTINIQITEEVENIGDLESFFK